MKFHFLHQKNDDIFGEHMGIRRALGTACMTIGLAFIGAGTSAQQPADGEWPMAARDHANTRYSPVGEITPANAGESR
jgi:hypothetical protein